MAAATAATAMGMKPTVTMLSSDDCSVNYTIVGSSNKEEEEGISALVSKALFKALSTRDEKGHRLDYPTSYADRVEKAQTDVKTIAVTNKVIVNLTIMNVPSWFNREPIYLQPARIEVILGGTGKAPTEIKNNEEKK
jgi:hypothetical protein